VSWSPALRESRGDALDRRYDGQLLRRHRLAVELFGGVVGGGESQSLLPSQSGRRPTACRSFKSRTGASDDVTLRLLVFTMLMAGVRFLYGMPGWIGRAGRLSEVQARLSRKDS
jgi:hypothetical protein